MIDVVLWATSIGEVPNKVTVTEDVARGFVLVLKWRERDKRGRTNWRYKSLKPLRRRTPEGKLLSRTEREMAEQKGRAEAIAHHARLILGLGGDGAAPDRPLTIGEAWDRITDPSTGKWPHESPYRDEVKRALAFAGKVLGATTPWNAIHRAELRKLGRARIDALAGGASSGYRGAEVTVQRVLTVAQWLRDEEMIDEGACVAASTWKDELRTYWREKHNALHDPTPNRPRHTIEEMRKILAAAESIDPRLHLLLALGAELRLGQVVRCRRSDLDLAHATLTVRGRGKKRGTVVELTPGQMRVVQQHLAGYLIALEASLPDYPLFPEGQLPGGRSGTPVANPARHGTAQPLGRRWILELFHEAERLAEVTVVKGRAAYGLKRVAVDVAKDLGISREGLMEHGGWADTQIPDMVYAEQERAQARKEARDVRAKIRGEESDG